jgi:hypothetical protein
MTFYIILVIRIFAPLQYTSVPALKNKDTAEVSVSLIALFVQIVLPQVVARLPDQHPG